MDEKILEILKMDLQIAVHAYDEFLENVIAASKAAIENEGIHLKDTSEDIMLVETYAAYLYRKRREGNAGMPRMLRWQLNNRLFSEKVQ